MAYRRSRKPTRATWKESISISLVCMIVAFILFLMTQIIWGEVLKDALAGHRTGISAQEAYGIIGGVLWIGIGAILGASILTGLLLFHKQYKKQPILVAATLSLVLTLMIMLIISYISMVLMYPSLWANLSIAEEIRLIGLYYVFFSIYVLGNPVLFWYITLFIFHTVLIVFIKITYKKKRAERTPVASGPLYTSVFLGDRPARTTPSKKRKTTKSLPQKKKKTTTKR